VPAVLFLLLWFGQQLISGLGSLGMTTSGSEGVAWWAHIGGFVFGLGAGLYFLPDVRAENDFE
jgi:membrane associated rhomboid family serine protease